MSGKTFSLTSLSAAILAASLVNSSVAADEKIETVYISATRAEGPQMPVATQIKVISEEDIRLSGATTITEVLRAQAGIQIQDLDGSGGRSVTVSMRGFAGSAANNTLVLVDGRKLNNPSLAGPALNTVALKDIERVEIIQGSAGVLYGDQAVGGVINIITHRARAGEIDGSVSVERGSYGLENYAARVTQGFENGLSYSLSAQKRNADNFRDNNETGNNNVLVNLGYSFAKGKVFVERQTIQDDLRLPGSLTAEQVEANPRQTLTPTDFANQDTKLTRTGGELEFIDGWRLLGEYADRDEDSRGYNYGDFTQNMRVKNFSPRVVGEIATAAGSSVLTLGYDNARSSYEATTYSAPNYNQDVDGFYGQVIYPFTKAFSVTAGIRHASVDDENNKKNLSRSESLNASEIGLNYQVESGWRIFGRVADGFRFANADENGYTLSGVNFLEVQTSQSQEIGVAWAGENANISYSLYQMDLEDEITFDPVAYRNVNLPDSERKGFIFDGEVVLSEQISLRGNYTYTDSELTSGSLKGKKVPFVANDTANFGIIFTFVPGLTASVDANYTGNRYQMDDSSNTSPKLDALTLFNANILWTVKDVELGFRVKNITSERYADYHSIYGQYPQPGRTYTAHISYTF
jgi:iron complex outermembrane recepter protein